MPRIELRTEIMAPREVVFDLARSVDLHRLSTQQTHESAVAGKTSGLMSLGEWVTWRARHFGIYQRLTSKITEMERPRHFVDEMVRGAFRAFRHAHHFEEVQDITVMTDVFEYVSPLGLLGRWADALFLERYMTRFLEQRNRVVKDFAESGRWRTVPGLAGGEGAVDGVPT